PILRGHRQVALARILWRVADLRADANVAGVRLAFTGEHFQGRGLTGAVAADKADPVAGWHTPRGRGRRSAGPGAQLQAGSRNHSGLRGLKKVDKEDRG